MYVFKIMYSFGYLRKDHSHCDYHNAQTYLQTSVRIVKFFLN